MEAVLAKKRIRLSRGSGDANDDIPRFDKYVTGEERLKSFEKWSISEIQTPLELVEAGFFYSGREDAVVCFSCGGGLSNWHQCVDPYFEHAKYYPKCSFILKKKGKDFVEKVKETVKDEYTAEEARLSSFANYWPISTFKTPKELAKAGFFHTGDSDEVQCFNCGVTVMDWRVDDDAWFKHTRSNSTCRFVFDVKGPEFMDKANQVELPIERLFEEELVRKGNVKLPIHENYKTYEQRIKTYKNWLISHKKKPEELAAIGLFYTGKSDRVQCFYCNGLHYCWKVTEDPSEEHARWYPICTFIREIRGDKFVDGVRQKWREIYGTEEARERSYKNWPNSANKTPKELSEAGFFCTENDDQAQCFYCGFWYMDWEVCDDAWFVHAKLNPFCEYLRKIKGETYVNKVEQTSSSQKTNERRRSYSSNQPVYKVEDDVIKELMNSSVVQTVLKVGFDEFKIKLTLQNYLKYHESFKNVKNFFAVIMNSQLEDPEVSACLQNLKKENDRYKDAKVCKICEKQGPILILVPCAHLLSCCSCVAKNLEHCFSCNKEIEYKLELFRREKNLF
ncbi:E3 ubiquitin-protein ligase XIAP-like [Planococcus citri]|uniref:E3 ubiquitin-protein ligase XIAP-like n=1 Tax=Planococcus citri TaxID=170843 RepID=UPI0031FA2C5D